MILALSQVTTWSLRGDVVTFNGGAPLRFRTRVALMDPKREGAA